MGGRGLRALPRGSQYESALAQASFSAGGIALQAQRKYQTGPIRLRGKRVGHPTADAKQIRPAISVKRSLASNDAFVNSAYKKPARESSIPRAGDTIRLTITPQETPRTLS